MFSFLKKTFIDNNNINNKEYTMLFGSIVIFLFTFLLINLKLSSSLYQYNELGVMFNFIDFALVIFGFCLLVFLLYLTRVIYSATKNILVNLNIDYKIAIVLSVLFCIVIYTYFILSIIFLIVILLINKKDKLKNND